MIADRLDTSSFFVGLNQHLDVVLKFLDDEKLINLSVGKHRILGDDLFALISEYDTKLDELHVFEAHRTYIDLHYIISGSETIKFAPIYGHKISREYDSESDYALYHQAENYNQITLEAGMFAIFFPWDLHLPGISEKPKKVRKVVLKIKSSLFKAQ